MVQNWRVRVRGEVMNKNFISCQPAWRENKSAYSRRKIVTGLTSFLAGMMISPNSIAQSSGFCVLTPNSGEGPFYFDPGLLRADIREDAIGAPLALAVQVVRQSDCAVLEGAQIDVWHADGLGLYSGYSSQPGVLDVLTAPAVDRTFLRGTQFTDAEGKVNFQTIYPSWYGGRTPHIHFKILLGQNEVIASQIFFPEEVNQHVFEQWQPYNEHVQNRSVFNDTDMFMSTNPIGGVLCEVESLEEGFQAEVVIAIADV